MILKSLMQTSILFTFIGCADAVAMAKSRSQMQVEEMQNLITNNPSQIVDTTYPNGSISYLLLGPSIITPHISVMYIHSSNTYVGNFNKFDQNNNLVQQIQLTPSEAHEIYNYFTKIVAAMRASEGETERLSSGEFKPH